MCQVSARRGTTVGHYAAGDYVFGGTCGPSKAAAQRLHNEICDACETRGATVYVVGDAEPFWHATFPSAEYVAGVVDESGREITEVPYPERLRAPHPHPYRDWAARQLPPSGPSRG